MEKNKNLKEHVESLRRTGHQEYVEAMRNGVRTRATTFRSGKEYRRNPKHKGNHHD